MSYIYNPTAWKNGDIITEERMNKIEAMLKELADSSISRSELTALLAEKQDKLVGDPGQIVGFSEDKTAIAIGSPTGNNIATDEDVKQLLDEIFV